jgi:hypothetical protein
VLVSGDKINPAALKPIGCLAGEAMRAWPTCSNWNDPSFKSEDNAMKKLISITCLFMIALSACNIPAPEPPAALPLEQQAATIVSQTLTAVTAGNNIPPASPTAGRTEQPLASPTGPAPTIQPNATATAGTGTATATTLTVDSNTNCREGPGLTYKIVIVLVPGTTYPIIARTTDNKYWIVAQQNTSTSCWVPAEFSNAFGDVTLLPDITPSAPTSSAGALQAPTGLRYAYSCAFNGVNSDITVSLRWTDNSNSETGFHVYRDNTLVMELAANSNTYTETFAGSASQIYSYRISAISATGEALGNPISFSCQ